MDALLDRRGDGTTAWYEVVWLFHFFGGGVSRSFGARKAFDESEHESQHLRLEQRYSSMLQY